MTEASSLHIDILKDLFAIKLYFLTFVDVLMQDILLSHHFTTGKKSLTVMLRIENTDLGQGALESNSDDCTSRALCITGGLHTVWPEAGTPSSYSYCQENIVNLILTQYLKIFKIEFLIQLV